MHTRHDDGGGHTWDRHVLLLHSSERYRRAGLAKWVQRGLDRHEKIIYVEPVSDPPSRRLVAVLTDAGIDTTQAAAGQLKVLSATEFYQPDRLPALMAQASAEGYPGMRVSAERSTALSVLTERNHDELEQDADELCRDQPVSVLCQYHTTQATGPRLATVAATHPSGIHDELVRIAAGDDALTATGEIDITNADLVGAALSAALRHARGVFRLDLSALGFLDVGGATAIQTASQQFRDAGGRLQVAAHGGPRLVLDTLAMADLPNLILTGGHR